MLFRNLKLPFSLVKLILIIFWWHLKIGFMAMKLDMSKTYDRVESKFLMMIMEKMGFCEKWKSLIF